MARQRKSQDAGFEQEEYFKPRNRKEQALAVVLSSLSNPKDAAALMRDLMTLPEIEEFANRLEMARLLLEGKSYLEIAQEIGVSATTVTRVAHWLNSGCGGYRKVLRKK